MGAMDSIKNALSSLAGNPNADDDYEDEYDYADDYEEKPAKTSRFSKPEAIEDNKVSKFSAKSKKNSVANNSQYQVNIVKPESAEQSDEIADSLKDGMAVLLNLSLVNEDTASNIYYFACGAAYALGGTMREIADRIWIIVPRGVKFLENSDEQATEE